MTSFTQVSPNNSARPSLPYTPQMPPHVAPFSFNHPITFSQQHCSWSSPLCSLLQSTVSHFLSATNITLSTLFSDTLNICSSLSIRQQV